MDAVTLIALVLLGATLAGVAAAAHVRGRADAGRHDLVATGTARVRRVLDGDTLVVDAGMSTRTLRLAGIDCPERDQEWGEIATSELVKLVSGQTLRIEGHGIDPYGRFLATVYVLDQGASEWINVNARMVALGHARVPRHLLTRLAAEKKRELVRLEHQARRNRDGLWELAGPVAPWRWRHAARRLVRHPGSRH